MSAAVEDKPELIGSRRAPAGDAEQDTGEDVVSDVRGQPTEASSSQDPKGKNVNIGTEGEEKPKPSKLKRIWETIDLDLGTLLMMFKYVCSFGSL